MTGNAGLSVRMLRGGTLAQLQQLSEGPLAAALVIVADTIALSGQFEGNIDTQMGLPDLSQSTCQGDDFTHVNSRQESGMIREPA